MGVETFYFGDFDEDPSPKRQPDAFEDRRLDIESGEAFDNLGIPKVEHGAKVVITGAAKASESMPSGGNIIYLMPKIRQNRTQ